MALVGSLNHNNVGREGAKALGEALKTNKTLQKLEHVASHPDSYCQQPLTLATPLFTRLVSLASPLGSVRDNKLGAEGGKAIAEGLCASDSLTQVCLLCKVSGWEVGICCG